MKKILFMVAAVASMVFTACNKEEFSVNENAPVGSIEFTASFDAETKTTFNNDNGKTEWIEGDEISINGVKFKANASGASVKFTNAETPQGEFKAPFKAVYPYTSDLPATQTVKIGTFADESVVSVAYIEGNDENSLTFKHVSSVIKFQVANDVASDIVFESSQNLAGKLKVNEDATYSVVSAGSKKITVKAEGGTFKKGETYYVSVLPTSGTTKVDFSVKVEGVAVKSGKASFLRNTIVDAKSVEVKYVYLKPNFWTSDNAWFSAHFWGNGDVDVKMVDSNTDGIFEAIIPYGSKNVIFCRMNPVESNFAWNIVYNQTEDLTLPNAADNKNFFFISDWQASDENKKSQGIWTSDPTIKFVGTQTNWLDNPITMIDKGDGSVILNNINVDKGAEFKFAVGEWDLSYGANDVDYDNQYTLTMNSTVNTKMKTSGLYNLSFNLSDKSLKVERLLLMKPNSNWTQSSARFAAYFFNNSTGKNTWVSMTDSDKDGIYEVKVPAGYPNVIFCRMKSGTTVNNWDNKWNQTGDLTIPTDGKNLFTVPSGSWDGATTTWSKKTTF